MHSRLANAKAKQHHTTQTISDPDDFVAVRSHATLCVALCKPRRPSVQLLKRELIRARWLEMARVISAAVIALLLNLSLSLFTEVLRAERNEKHWKANIVSLKFESSWKFVQHGVWSGLVRAWLQGPCPTIANCVCETGIWMDQQIKKAVWEIVHDTTAFLDSTTK